MTIEPAVTTEQVIQYEDQLRDIGVACAEFFYEHPGVVYPPMVALALRRLETLEYNPLRPIISDSDVTEEPKRRPKAPWEDDDV